MDPHFHGDPSEPKMVNFGSQYFFEFLLFFCFSFINAMIFFEATELEKIEESYDGRNPMGNCELEFLNNTIFVIFRHTTHGL